MTADSRWAERAEQADEQNGPGGRAGRWADWAGLAGGTGQVDGTIWQAGATWQPVLELRMTADSRRISDIVLDSSKNDLLEVQDNNT